MGNNPSGFPGSQRPVEMVSWIDIVDGNQGGDGAPAFLTLMNNQLAKEKPGLAATHEFRLPTEAEWEYAAKGGSRYSRKNLKTKKQQNAILLTPAATVWRLVAGSGRIMVLKPRPVGLKAGNELGLYDMSGNVWEWCHDWHGYDTYKNRKKPVPTNPDGLRAVTSACCAAATLGALPGLAACRIASATTRRFGSTSSGSAWSCPPVRARARPASRSRPWRAGGRKGAGVG